MRPQEEGLRMEKVHHSRRGSRGNRGFQSQNGDRRGKAIYRQRSQIAEFPHAWIKERCGLRQFRCRGKVKASMEATWACLSYNIIRWVSIRRKLDGAALA